MGEGTYYQLVLLGMGRTYIYVQTCSFPLGTIDRSPFSQLPISSFQIGEWADLRSGIE
jgi:hypothetical protein